MQLPGLPTPAYPTRLSKKQEEYHQKLRQWFDEDKDETITLQPIGEAPPEPKVKKKKEQKPDLYRTIPAMKQRKAQPVDGMSAFERLALVPTRRVRPTLNYGPAYYPIPEQVYPTTPQEYNPLLNLMNLPMMF